eukprot:snap_masked-scaffold_4-processed-gene-14.12-mRNA-1 protein AED:1.00 eAED:1.00 QI:0/0/0/0/1/1/2/0/83
MLHFGSSFKKVPNSKKTSRLQSSLDLSLQRLRYLQQEPLFLWVFTIFRNYFSKFGFISRSNHLSVINATGRSKSALLDALLLG